MSVAPQSPQGHAGLILENLTAGDGRKRVLHKLGAGPLRAGHIIAVLGPNGCGKSTLLKTLAGLLPASAGRICLDGRDLTAIPADQRARQIVYVPQALPPAVHLRVFESVLVAARASPLLPAATRLPTDWTAAIMALLTRLGIASLAMHYLDQLSGGQKQLVGLAQALIRQPRLLLLDEPLSALDLNHHYYVMNVLRQETDDRQLITCIVLHDLNTALQHCDQVLLMQAGHALRLGAPTDVLTPARLAAVYGVDARVERCSRGIPHLMVDGLSAPYR